MRAIRNPQAPTGAPIASFTYNGKVVAPFPIGEILVFDDDKDDLANFMLETYGFLREERTDNIDQKTTGKSVCVCGFEAKPAKNDLGLRAHQRRCEVYQANPEADKDKKQGVKKMEYVGEVKGEQTRGITETGEKDDTPDYIKVGRIKVEQGNLGGVKEFSYDRDGVGFYGPGIEDDSVDPSMMIPDNQVKHGRF